MKDNTAELVITPLPWVLRRWTFRVESQPMRGKELSQQPAVVRTVLKAQCQGQNAPDFWEKALGFTAHHDILKKGHRYRLVQNGIVIQAGFTSCTKC